MRGEPDLLFELRLALCLNRTLAELRRSITSDELTLWHAYALVEGLPVDRLVAGTAIAGAAVAATWGAKLTPADLVPKFDHNPVKVLNYAEGSALFAGWAANHNRRMGAAGIDTA